MNPITSYSILYAHDSAYVNTVTLRNTIDCPNTSPNQMKSVSYKSEYGSTYIAIPPATGSKNANTKTSVEVTCTLTKCMRNSYLSSGACVKCPPNRISAEGSTSVDQCTRCPGGTNLTHELGITCAVSTTYRQIASSKGWRLWTTDYHSHLDWIWNVQELEYFESIDCTGIKIPNTGTAVDSGNAGGRS